jgi:patatin-like phospholipase/acyl hydrolase
VVCREFKNETRLKPRAVCICSLLCSNTDRVKCCVCQAARATSAAPTFFTGQEKEDRRFVDGGLHFNNPSHAIFQHYAQPILVEESRRESATEHVPQIISHGTLDFSEVCIVNLGTGTKAGASAGRLSLVGKFVPQNATLLTAMKDIVVDSEKDVEAMKTLARFNCGLKYERFNANNGVGDIGIDRYKELREIAG